MFIFPLNNKYKVSLNIVYKLIQAR